MGKQSRKKKVERERKKESASGIVGEKSNGVARLPRIMKTILPENILRYVFANSFCYDKDVIDVGCKYGQGTEMFATYAKSYIGVDIKKYDALKDINFKQLDFTLEIPYKNDFDVAICLEVLEHLINPVLLLNNIKKALRKDGTLIVSVPCIDRKVDTHLKAFYTKKELIDLLGGIFKVKSINSFFGISWMVVCKQK